MKWGIDSFKDGVELVSWIVGAIALGVATFTYYLNRHQFRFAVMTNCIDRYQKLIAQLNYGKSQDKNIALGQYIDLCNEELFYFQKKYLPTPVVDEWLEGMVNYLPLFNVKGDNLNSRCIPEILEKDLLADYPRIKRTFTVSRDYDLSKESEEKELIAQLKKNLYRKSK
jgi:hypothetical protein